ncbi:MAG: hypothetical protein M1833_002367 [Piccolia ochrophora]|nr:MAG: hypothetical protein M1833_002367 [Piccolia ochrophora]
MSGSTTVELMKPPGTAAPAGMVELETFAPRRSNETSRTRATIQYMQEPLTNLSQEVSRLKTAVIIAIVTGTTILNTVLSGILTVALPRMAKDLALEANLLLWPISVYALTCGCTLLLSGAIADVIGSRFMYLLGCGLLIFFTLGCGLAKTGIQLIMFRAFSGVAISFCLPSAVSIITNSFPTGQRRNVAFSCLGAGQPIGFSLGLMLGGVFVDGIGWRYGYHIAAIVNVVVFVGAIWGLPASRENVNRQQLKDIDWTGALLASTSMGLLSYVFAMVTASHTRLKQPQNIVFLCIALALIPLFILWVGRQERLGRPAIMPNSLWKNHVFTCVCIMVAVTWAVLNAITFFMTLYFQEIQGVSALHTSLRFLPMVVAGALTNVVMGIFVNRFPANILVLGAAIISAMSPLLMAVIQPDWPYWYSAFPAVLLAPICCDVLFTVSNLVITSVFPARTQALAGSVFNVVSQFGNSLGVALTAVLASSVTKAGHFQDQNSREALMKGYNASFWACFGATVGTIVVSAWGLRRIGRVGLKTE